jgi:exonuclease III
MDRTFQILQLNVRKRDMVQQSLLNDESLKDFSALAISEPYFWKNEENNAIVVTPVQHHNWTKMIPTTQHEGRWAIRSMLWIRKDLEAMQVAVESADITAAILRLPDRSILISSIYVPPTNPGELQRVLLLLRQLIESTYRQTSTRLEVVVAGDFNQHDQLWGGQDVSRQGEADPIIDFIAGFSLHSLLPRGTKTWASNGRESTIDLIFASDELAATLIKCGVHEVEHGSDHRAIETTFDIAPPERTVVQRLLFKNAPWKAIRERIAVALQGIPMSTGTQAQTDQLMTIVLEAVYTLTPIAKPSPYAKRWWTTNLTNLRRAYTYQRNQARANRRMGTMSQVLERRANEAAKEYHDAIRRQKKVHWQEFLEDDANIWQAARFLDPRESPAFDKVPPLVRVDGSTTQGKEEQAAELLETFFPTLPQEIEDEPIQHQRPPVPWPQLTMEEVERRVFAASSWKAPGDDGLPAEVWKQIWPVVKERVLLLFQTSLVEGILPTQWKNAKIIPLKKPGKGDYTKAKAWRPISLLATLGKILEAIVAERISYAVETFGLLPTNHFGARKKRSTEQALLLLQEHIYKAWRSRKVLSLISFDVKGAYNGVHKEKLIQRLQARGIPPMVVRWIRAFCSVRTATIAVNGYTSPQQQLLQAGLPQGSPLSPILYLFFNADLVQQRINNKGGSLAFIDDYTAWVTGSSAEANYIGLQQIVDKAVQWEKRSGATFESTKTVLVHFTRATRRSSNAIVTFKGETISPKSEAKILGVIMDSRLRYKNHIARTAAKGLNAALALKRLKMLSPSSARQLFNATVVPVMDYASNVWMHAARESEMAALNKAQRIGAQAITGAFQSVAVAIAEAEAYIRPVHQRHNERATKLWIGIHTLPDTHPLKHLRTRAFQRFVSPLQKIALAHQPVKGIETIQSFAVPPWDKRINTIVIPDHKEAAQAARDAQGIVVAVCSSEKNGIVGMGGAVCDTTSAWSSYAISSTSYAVTLGSRDRLNPYFAELIAISTAIQSLVGLPVRNRVITILSSNLSALQAINHPRQQSGQSYICQIYEAVDRLKATGNQVFAIWAPAHREVTLKAKAKEMAKQATRPGREAQEQTLSAKSTVLRLAKQKHQGKPIEGVGEYTRKLDTALPGKHTYVLYNSFKRIGAGVLAQLRTGMAQLNGYLHRIGRAETDLCACGQAKETVEHFLFRCSRWNQHRVRMLQQIDTKMGCLSFCLGGKALSDPPSWKPNLAAVRATVQYAIATGRLAIED